MFNEFYTRNIVFSAAIRSKLYESIMLSLSADDNAASGIGTFLQGDFPFYSRKIVTTICKRAIARMREGQQMADVFQAALPTEDLAVLRAVEGSENVVAGMGNLIARLNRSNAEGGHFVKLIAPYIMTVVAFTSYLFSGNYIREIFSDVGRGSDVSFSELGMSLQFIVGFSHLGIGGVLFVAAIPWALWLISSFVFANWTGNARAVADRFWPFRRYRKQQGIALLTSVAYLQKNRIAQDEAVRTFARHVSAYTQKEALGVLASLSEGSNLGDALLKRTPAWPSRDIALRVYGLMKGSKSVERFYDHIELLQTIVAAEHVKYVNNWALAWTGVAIWLIALNLLAAPGIQDVVKSSIYGAF